MASPQDLALLSLRVYGTPRAVNGSDIEFNRPALPDGWIEVEWHPDDGWGSSYGIYSNGAEVVVAFAGTNEKIDVLSDLTIPFALSSPQAKAAAMAVVRASAYGSDITLTGHSLGGGLASVMATWFDRPAVVFDEAPFKLTARNVYAITYIKFALDLAGYTSESFTIFNALADFFTREQKVENYYVGEEALQILRLFLPTVLGTDNRIEVGSDKMLDSFGRVDLHSQSLLVSALLSEDFRTASTAVQQMLPVMMDTALYNFSTKGTEESIWIELIRSEQAHPTDGALTHLGLDVLKLSNLPENSQKALIAQALDWYYAKPDDEYDAEFFDERDGALQYSAAAFAFPDGMDKATKYVKTWLEPMFMSHGIGYAANLAVAEEWTVAKAEDGAAASAQHADKTQLFIGGDAADTFTGGALQDVLFGAAGDDTLIGGAGDDKLFGGANDDLLEGGSGNDEYRIEGHDTIVDADGEGFVETRSGARVAGVIEKHADGTYTLLGDPLVTVSGSDAEIILTFVSGDSVTLRNFHDGDLGFQLNTSSQPETTDRTIMGDLAPKDVAPSTPGLQTQTDELGNIITDPNTPQPDRDDFLYDSAGNDNIQGKGGYDYIDAFRGGDDLLDGGAGQDVVLGRAGKDTVIGGDGADVIRGDGDDDAVYGEHQISLDDAVAANEAAGSGLQGDFAEGDAGDDTVVGGAGNDALLGGNGEDVIVGGAGDDNIDGDLETHFVSIAWGISRSIVTQADGSTLYAQQYSYVTFDYPTVGGDDVIFAGAGNDWVIARFGDDYVDGGSGDDVLFGDAGNDEVLGGDGNDRVFGDSAGVPVDQHGDDYLDGGEGNDQIFGYGGSDDMFGGSGNDSMYGDGSDIATSGDDYMDGEDGDDSMFGGAKDDQMFGGAGDDTIVGDRGSSTGTGDGDDSLSGEDGDDLLIGEGGKDTLDGGDGKDQIAGDHGGSDPSGDDDLIFGGAGNDTIDGQGGNDSIDAGADNDLVAGGEGNDSIFGGDGADQLQGGKGDDQLDGGSGDDTLFGQDGNDTITGGDGSDLTIGGAGDDVLIGGTGNNFYYWNQGDGNDTISDSGGDDWLVFNDIGLGQVGLGVGSLKLMLPGGASIDLTDFDPDNPNGPGGIEHFFFAPQGVSYTKQQLIQALGGFKPTGTPGPDTLSGTALNDTMHGLESDDVLAGRAGNDQMFGDAGDDDLRGGDGNDSISGGDGDDIIQGDNGNDTLLGDSGNDILTGGAGNDVLLGGQGNDVYVFIRGDGQDTAVDTAGVNRVALGGDLTLDAVLFGRSMNDLTVTIKGTTDKLTIKDWFTTGSTFSDVIVADGQSLDHAAVDANMPTNLPPSTQPDAASVIEDSVLSASGNALANDNDPEGHALRLTNAGSYVGMYGTLTLQANGTYAYTLANGSAPVQSLGANQVGTDTFTYMVTDDDTTAPATAEGTIVVSVHGTNDAPAVIGDAASVVEGGAALSGNVLANDHDVDAGTTLFIAGSGTGIGGWGTLTLHADGSWTYQLANGTNAVESLGAGQSVTDTFTFNVSDGIAEVSESLVITVFGEDDAPFISQPISDQVAAANTRWTWQVPGTSFGDIDFGDTLSYGAAQTNGTALPSWLTFDPVTHTFDGRVPKGTIGSIDIRVIATDKSGLAISDVFNLSFSGSKGGGGGGGGSGSGGKGGGSGGGSGGNEGPGNGEDPPPPGHTYNFNDGPGTSPGSPGAQGGNGYVPPPQALTPPALIDVQGQLPATPAVPASDSDGAQAFLVGVNGALLSESYAI